MMLPSFFLISVQETCLGIRGGNRVVYFSTLRNTPLKVALFLGILYITCLSQFTGYFSASR